MGREEASAKVRESLNYTPITRQVVRAVGFDAGQARQRYAGVVKAAGCEGGEGRGLTWASSCPGATPKPSREAWLSAERAEDLIRVVFDNLHHDTKPPRKAVGR